MRYSDPTGLFSEEELLAYGVSPDLISAWKDDFGWWGLISEARLGDMVSGMHWSWDGWGGTAKGVFSAAAYKMPGHDYPFSRLILSGYEGGLENFRSSTQNRSLWRSQGAQWKQRPYGTTFMSAPGKVVGYREVVKYHPERVDWVDVGLDVATIATLGIAGAARAASAAKNIDQAGNVISAVQIGKSAVSMASGSSADLAASGLQVTLNVASLAPSPWIQWPLAVTSLYVDLDGFTEVRQVPIYE